MSPVGICGGPSQKEPFFADSSNPVVPILKHRTARRITLRRAVSHLMAMVLSRIAVSDKKFKPMAGSM